jgi:ataxia telangiectasia mutated family protein
VLRAGVLDEISQPELVLSAMFANGSQGPSVLTDAALSLWHSILASGESGSVEFLHSVSLRAISWLNTHWTLPPVLDRLHNASLARHSREDCMYKLFMACMNISTGLKHKDFSIITSPIYIRRSHIMDSLPATRYLLHQSESNDVPCGALTLSSPVTADASSRGRIQHAICELLLVKLKNFRDAWNKLQQERSSNFSTDIIQILSSACTVASAVSAAIDNSTTALCKDVVVLIGNIWTDICGLLSALGGDLRQQCLTLAASSLLRVDPQDEKERISLVKRRQVLTVPILELLRQCLAQDLSQNEIEDDMMDGQDSFAVQNSQNSSDFDTSQIPRQKVPFATDMHTLLVQLTCRMLISELEGQFSEGDDPRVAAAVIDFAAELKPADVVAARQALTEFFDSSPTIARTDATRLLQALAETCLQEVDFERCEAALCLCVDVLASLAKVWTIDNGDDLASMACDMYEWYLDTAVGKGIATEKVMLAIARMLTAVSASDTTFGSGMSLPSPRTSLLRLLKAGNHVVQFNLADLICQIFKGFVLSEHWAIFDDVVAGLPADAERVEGIAVRLYILGKLGSRWHTLLRKAVYSVFETAAKVTTALPFAQKCFKAISDSLGLLETRELFILFSPQILYTWLEKESLDSIPFQAFEYKDLLSLFRDVQNEAVSQIAMRSRTSHATAVAQLTGQAWSQMLCGGFVEAEAYCIARDIGTPRDEQSKASEALLRKQLGNDIYLEQIQERFPQILARLFTIISDDHGVEKALSKRRSLGASQVVLTEIYKRSQSTTVLPKGQQPSYRAKYILDEIDYLCKRIDRDFTSIWEPSLVVYVCRILFDSAIPSLGPLHACAVIRKVRIVVCLAQRQALKGYALEMLLHTLRPFLTDFHCSEDALGLFWYLLDHGKSYLESHVSFFASLVVSTFATISMFLKSSQDSTTQESHFKSTMSKVQAFREWMVKYVQGFEAVNVSAERSRTFGTVMLLASGINAQGGSTKGTPKGDLIYLLLQDQRASERLLSRTAFVQVMELLCHNFVGTVAPQDDILYSDEDAVEVGPILWGLLSKITNSPFTVWVAQVIGRAYACSGYVDGAESNERHSKSSGLMTDKMQGHSYVSIVDSLATMLRKDDRRMSGVAERALQLIFTAFTTQEKSSHFSSVVETSLLDGLTWTDFPCPKSIPGLETTKRMHATLNAPHEQSAQTWACNVAVALCGKSQSDPLLLALPVVLSAVPALATDMLPSIVHIVLLAETNGQQPTRQALSMVINETLADWKEASKPDHIKLILDVLLYLRHQPLPTESTMADRNMWLDVSLTDAAEAASSCGMQSAALLFLELAVSQQTLASARSSRKSSVLQLEQYDDLLQQIFSSVNDPDFFFGTQEKASLQSVLSKLAHEDSAYKNLSFQSALFDTECRISNSGLQSQDSDIVAALSRNNLNGIARAVQLQTSTRSGKDTNGGVLQIAMNLHQWDLPFQAQEQSSTTIVLGTLRAFENFSSTITLAGQLDSALKNLLNPIAQEKLSTKSIQSNLGAMAILTELRELLSAPGIDDLRDEMGNQTARARWEAQERYFITSWESCIFANLFCSFDLVSPILVGREAAMTAIKSSTSLRTHFRMNLSEAQLLEIDAVRNSVKVARSYNAAQFCLNRVMYLSKLMEMPTFSSHKVEAAILHDTAHVLWDQGETSASIQMLRQLQDRNDLGQQTVSVSRAEILADLGNQIAEARLNKPDEIIAQYLIPAIGELRGKSEGAEAGRVFHNFAVFCDMQLQNAEDKEEFARVESLRQSKNDDIDGWTELVRAASADPKKRDTLKKHLGQAKQWFKLDDEEYQRLKKVRERFIAQSLENYLRSMAASDMYVNDTLRFVALWLDQSDSENAQAAVGKYLATVPSRKFAPLANQLFSRILDSTDSFQQLLTGLLYRVCCDHPHHSLYQLFAASKSKAAKNDLVANSRYGAAGKLAEKIMKQSHPGLLWVALHNCSIAFVRLANEKVTDQKIKSGSKILLRNI